MKIIKLEEVCRFISGFAFSSENFTHDKSKGIGLIRIRDIKNGLVTETNYTGVYDDKYVVSAGDYLIGMDGEFRCYQWKGANALLNQRVCKLIADQSRLDSRYFYYAINKYLKEIEDVTSFTTVKHISVKQIMSINLPMPSLDEQRKVVAKLDAVFESIDVAIDELIKCMKYTKSLNSSVNRSIFKNEKNKINASFADICDEIFAGGDVLKERSAKNKSVKYSVPIFTNGEKGEGLYGYTDIARVAKPSVTISARGTIGFTALRRMPFYPAVRLIVLTPDVSRVDVEYLYFAAKNLVYANTGTSIPQLTTPMVKTYQIPLPSLKEQRYISQKLTMINEKTKEAALLCKKEISYLRAPKQSMLNEAFSDKVNT